VELTQHTREYWKYEYDVCALFMIPLLRSWGVTLEGRSVLDVGCGEGGGLCALFDQGAVCVGFDIDEYRIQVARELQRKRTIGLTTGNLYANEIPYAGRDFDLLVLHDVFEHLERKPEMLEKLKGYMKPDGRMLITFPPYFSAYGAHQQHLHSSIARLPFFHLIPFAVSTLLPRLPHEPPAAVAETQKLAGLKMGMAKFEDGAHDAGLTIVGKQTYLISPNHIRFGLKPVHAGLVSRLPIVRELLCSGVVYVLAKGAAGVR
jgi:SAM-dependent methyltransferase